MHHNKDNPKKVSDPQGGPSGSSDKPQVEAKKEKKSDERVKQVEENKSQSQSSAQKQTEVADTVGVQKSDKEIATKQTRRSPQNPPEVRQSKVLDLQEHVSMSSQPNVLDLGEAGLMDQMSGQVGQPRDYETDQSQLRTNLYEYFPSQRHLVDEAFREYYAFRSDEGEKNDSGSGQSAEGGRAKNAAVNLPLSQQSSVSVPIVTSYEILVEKLKQKLGDFEILTFFNTT